MGPAADRPDSIDRNFVANGRIRMDLSAGDYRISGGADNHIRIEWRTRDSDQLAKVKARDEDPEERAVAMCWVFHLIGDAHQPLHVTQLYSTQFPKGDRGGRHDESFVAQDTHSRA